MGGAGAHSRSPLPIAGVGGVSGLFMYLLHTHQPMQVPTPAPMFLCLCSFPLSPQQVDQTGATSFGISRVSHLGDPHLLPASPIFTPHQRELAVAWCQRW